MPKRKCALGDDHYKEWCGERSVGLLLQRQESAVEAVVAGALDPCSRVVTPTAGPTEKAAGSEEDHNPQEGSMNC